MTVEMVVAILIILVVGGILSLVGEGGDFFKGVLLFIIVGFILGSIVEIIQFAGRNPGTFILYLGLLIAAIIGVVYFIKKI